jgi:uncharacterized protein YdaU (DUF1376 family)
VSLPWFPFYAADYLADTGHLTVAEHGAYLMLILHYWDKGGLPDSDALVRRIARMTPEQWAESREVLAALFGPGWRHKRIDAELAEAAEKVEMRKERSRKGNAARHGSVPKSSSEDPTRIPEGSSKDPHLTMHIREGTEETKLIIINDDESLSVFPRDGSIEFTGWAAIVREAGRNIDVDDLASAFRKWCRGKDILFDDKRIEKTFRTFVATHNAKPPGGESSESRDFRPMTATPVPSVFIADNSPEWQAFAELRRKQGRPALKIADGQRGQGQWVKPAEMDEVRAIMGAKTEIAA